MTATASRTAGIVIAGECVEDYGLQQWSVKFSSHFVTLSTLGLTPLHNTTEERLSCTGLVFSLYGRDSIRNVLSTSSKTFIANGGLAQLGSHTLDAIHQRLYARLVMPIDSLVRAAAEPGYLRCTAMEAEILINQLRDAYPQERDSLKERQEKFYLAQRVVETYYRHMVVDVWREYETGRGERK